MFSYLREHCKSYVDKVYNGYNGISDLLVRVCMFFVLSIHH